MIIRKFTLILGVLVACPAPAQAFDIASAGKAAWQSVQDFAGRLTSSFSTSKISEKTMAIVAIGTASALAALCMYRALHTQVPSNPSTANQGKQIKELVAHITPELLKGDVKQLQQACYNVPKNYLSSGVCYDKIKECITAFINDRSITLNAAFIVMKYLSGDIKYVLSSCKKELENMAENVSSKDLAAMLSGANEEDIEDFCLIIRAICDLSTRNAIAQEVAPVHGEKLAISGDHIRKTRATLKALFYNTQRDGTSNVRTVYGKWVSFDDEDRAYTTVTIVWQQPPRF